MLKGKHIILGITGGIAAYKAVILLRLLIKAGAEVQVVITPSGKEFITPVTLSALSGKPVISEFFTANTGSWNSHVDLGLWADLMVIAPATASSIGKMANGIADNMLITTYLSAKCPVFIAPSMDLDMFAHPSTKRNLELLRGYGNHIIEPASGELASHLIGKGRMEEPENIVNVLNSYFINKSDFKNKNILITAGPTYEKIDPVRFIGNFSSGKTGYAIANEFAYRGANVTIISGPTSMTVSHPNINVVNIESGREMLEECLKRFDNCDCAIMSAAVADYHVKNVSDRKIKREKDEVPQIILEKNPDIAYELGKRKKTNQCLVGFALETNDAELNAKHKLGKKNLDFIVLNSVTETNKAFGVDTNKITIIDSKSNKIECDSKNKKLIAKDIANYYKENYL